MEELTSVYICYSQGNGFYTALSRLLHSTVHTSSVCVKSVMFWRVLFPCLVPTSDDGNKDYVCTLPISTRINRLSHLRLSRARPFRAPEVNQHAKLR